MAAALNTDVVRREARLRRRAPSAPIPWVDAAAKKGLESESETETETETETEPESESEPVPEPESEPETETEPESDFGKSDPRYDHPPK